MYLDSLILSDLWYLQWKIDKFPKNLDWILKRDHGNGDKLKFTKVRRFDYILYNEWTKNLFKIKTNNSEDMSDYRKWNVYTSLVWKNIVIYFIIQLLIIFKINQI